MEILSFLKKLYVVFEVFIFGDIAFFWQRKCYFMQKVVIFEQVSKLLRTLIKSCCANFGESDKCLCQH